MHALKSGAPLLLANTVCFPVLWHGDSSSSLPAYVTKILLTSTSSPDSHDCFSVIPVCSEKACIPLSSGCGSWQIGRDWWLFLQNGGEDWLFEWHPVKLLVPSRIFRNISPSAPCIFMAQKRRWLLFYDCPPAWGFSSYQPFFPCWCRAFLCHSGLVSGSSWRLTVTRPNIIVTRYGLWDIVYYLLFGCFSCCCGQIDDTDNFKGGVDSSRGFRPKWVRHDSGSVHITVGQEGEGNATQLATFCLLWPHPVLPDAQPMVWNTFRVSPSHELILSVHILIVTPRGVSYQSLGWFKVESSWQWGLIITLKNLSEIELPGLTSHLGDCGTGAQWSLCCPGELGSCSSLRTIKQTKVEAVTVLFISTS